MYEQYCRLLLITFFSTVYHSFDLCQNLLHRTRFKCDRNVDIANKDLKMTEKLRNLLPISNSISQVAFKTWKCCKHFPSAWVTKLIFRIFKQKLSKKVVFCSFRNKTSCGDFIQIRSFIPFSWFLLQSKIIRKTVTRYFITWTF